MNTYSIGFTSEFEEFLLTVKFEKQFSDVKTATNYVDNDVQGILVSGNSLNLIVNDIKEEFNANCKYCFKQLISSRQKVLTLSKDDIDKLKSSMSTTDFCSFIFSEQFFLDEKRDYSTISGSIGQVSKQLCKLYGNREYFIFSILSCSVEESRRLNH